MIEQILKSDNIPIGAALLALVLIFVRYLSTRDKAQEEVARDASEALRQNTAAISKMEGTLTSMNIVLQGMRATCPCAMNRDEKTT